MSITFNCPHCRKPLKVKDELAGKKAKCPGCQKVIAIPASPSQAPVSPDGRTAGKGDVDSLALAAFSEPSQPAPATKPGSKATIDFHCPYCDERIRMGADLAGKRAPCPECRRIIKVPLLVKEEPKDWRKIDTRNPLASRRGEDAVPEGAWGSTTSTAKVSRQALLEAKAIVPAKERWTTQQWINRVSAGVAALVVVAGSLWFFRLAEVKWTKAKAFNRAEELAKSQDLDLLSAAEVYRGMGAFQRRAEQSREGKDSADLTRDLFGEARAKLSAEPKETPERDAQLIDLALEQIDLGGDQQQVIKRTRLRWDDIARELRQTLQQVRSPQARLEGLREVESKLIRLGQDAIAVNLPGSVLDLNDSDRAEALGRLGLLLLDQKEQAATQETNARQAFTGKKDAKGKPVAPAASWIALNLALGRNETKEAAPPPEGDGPDVPLSIRIGYAWGWAYLGQIENARKLAKAEGPAGHQFQAYLAIAEAQVHKKADAKQDLEAAANLIELALKEKESELSPWLVLRLVRLSLRADDPEMAAQFADPEMAAQFADRIPDSGLRSRAQVVVKLSSLQPDMEALTAAAQQKPVCPYALLTLARHNARYGSSSAVLKMVDSWEDDALRPLGYIGVALGMQDSEK
jgi:hypothetical protein